VRIGKSRQKNIFYVSVRKVEKTRVFGRKGEKPRTREESQFSVDC